QALENRPTANHRKLEESHRAALREQKFQRFRISNVARFTQGGTRSRGCNERGTPYSFAESEASRSERLERDAGGNPPGE
ncbi:hypothetical protein K0M31_000135, partial [Melipona bicolor]